MTDLTQEQLEIRALAREFAVGEIRAGSASWEAAREVDPSIYRQLAELGFFGLRAPESLGGLGLDTLTYLLTLEQLAWGDASVAFTLASHNGAATEILVRHGSDEQKRHWLPRVASGETRATVSISARDNGGQPAALGVTARRDGEGWRLEGTEPWVVDGGVADVVIVFARTGDGAIGAFLVESGQSGFRVDRRETTLGFRATEFTTIGLDVRVEPDCVLGQAHDSSVLAREALDVGRLGVAAIAVGIATAALEHAIDYARERRQFGRAIADFGAIQEKLAVTAARIDSARAYTLGVGRRLDALHASDQEPDGPEALGISASCAAAKLLASDVAMFATDEAVQIFGGYGYMREYPVERLMRDAKGTEIYEGTSQALHALIARDLLAAPLAPIS
jgi:alkylation response protein AidB-like acyl-CoA dehydrogenase